MLANALDVLKPGDVLLLDSGYPAARLVHMLNACSIGFVMCCDSVSGWRGVRQFIRDGHADAQIILSAPNK